MMNPYLQVAIGGAIGSVARFGLYRAVSTPGFPAATMLVNVIGSLAIGVLAAVLVQRGGQGWAPFLVTGILGGFTTFSAFSLDVVSLWTRGQAGLAWIYALGSVALALLAVLAGLWLGRGLSA